jgi:ABC-type lipoprotein release transport system permease subunit
MRALLAIAGAGLTAVLLHPLRGAVTISALLAVLVPFLACVGLSQGIEKEAETSLQFGADLYVTGSQFGRPVPVPLAVMESLRQIDGVLDVVPRIVAEIILGKDRLRGVLVGLPGDKWPEGVRCVRGRLPGSASRNELVLGTELARRLRLDIGSLIPPFYHNDRGERISEVVGVFQADAPLWQANLVLTSFETAATICNQSGLATDLLVYCREGSREQIRQTIQRMVSQPSSPGMCGVRLRVAGREDLTALLHRTQRHREGIFSLHFVLLFIVTILVVVVTSGAGLSERRREIGILKATGWQTDEVLLRALVESFVLSLAGACLAVVLAWIWLKPLNAWGLAALFLPDADAWPSFRVPSRLTPVPALLAFVFSFALIMTGTLFSSWRVALASPWEAMRGAPR